MLFLFLLYAVQFSIINGFLFDQKCPEQNVTQDISYRHIRGNWILAANYPDINERCKNISIPVLDEFAEELHEEYIEHTLFGMIWRKSSNSYSIIRLFKSPTLILQSMTFPYFDTEYTLIKEEYGQYLILHKCNTHFFEKKSESYEVWIHDKQVYNVSKLQNDIRESFKRLELNVTELSYRTLNDCLHKDIWINF